jgi:uncharacterized Zn finger protein (UPF0148 family)
MELCSDGHKEVCHNEVFCPVCKTMEKLETAERAIVQLEAKVEELNTAE